MCDRCKNESYMEDGQEQNKVWPVRVRVANNPLEGAKDLGLCLDCAFELAHYWKEFAKGRTIITTD